MNNLDLLIPKTSKPADTFVWATVTQDTPLRVRLDGDDVSLTMTPYWLFPKEAQVGMRVWVQMSGRNVIVHGPSKGVDFTPDIEAARLNAIEYADAAIEFAMESVPGDIVDALINAKNYADEQIADEAESINADIATVKSGASIAPDAIKTSHLDALAITSKHSITGPLFQTHAAAARGIKIVSSANAAYGSLIAYDAAGVPTLTLNGQTGAISMKGALTSGSTITGATLTGGVVETVATAFRGIKMVNNKLIAYSATATSDADATLVINGADGAIAMKGNLTSGSNISGATISGSSVTSLHPSNGSKSVMTAGAIQMYSNVAGELYPGGLEAGSWVWNGATAGKTTVSSPHLGSYFPARVGLWQGNDKRAGAELWASADTHIQMDDSSGLIHMKARANGVYKNGKFVSWTKPVDFRYQTAIYPSPNALPPGGAMQTIWSLTWIPWPQGAAYAHVQVAFNAQTDTTIDTDAQYYLKAWDNFGAVPQANIAYGYAHNRNNATANMSTTMSGYWNSPSYGASGQYLHLDLHAQIGGGGWVAFRPGALNITFFS